VGLSGNHKKIQNFEAVRASKTVSLAMLVRVRKPKRLSMKDIRTKGGGMVVQCGQFSDKGGRRLQMQTFRRLLFLVKKTSDFFKFMVCLQGKEGGG